MSADIPYDLDALRDGLKRCDNNIKIFEDAISREYVTIQQYKKIIVQLEMKRANEQ